jgi:hypothetical protein
MTASKLSTALIFISILLMVSCDAESITQPGGNGNGSDTSTALILGGSDDDIGTSVIQTFDNGFLIVGSTASVNGIFGGQNLGDQDIFALKLDSNGNIEWLNNYGGNNIDGATDVIEDQAGNFVIAGFTRSNSGNFSGQFRGNTDAVMIKINPNGNFLWARTYGGSNEDIAFSVTEGPNGGYILAGSTRSVDGNFPERNNNSSDAFLILTDINGQPAWARAFGGTADDEARSVTISQQNGIITAGSFQSSNGVFANSQLGQTSFFALETELNGNLVGLTTYGGSGIDIANSIIRTLDGGYAITGTSSSDNMHFEDLNKGDQDAFIMKLNAARNIEWIRNIGGTEYDEGHSLVQRENGDFIVSGETDSPDGEFEGQFSGSTDAFLVRLNQSGDMVQQRAFGGSDVDTALSLFLLPDGRIAVTGWTESTNGDFNSKQGNDRDIFFLIDSFSSTSE